jgi:TonB family protein
MKKPLSFPGLSKDWSHVILGQMMSRLWNFAVPKIVLLILGTIGFASGYGQNARSTPLPQLAARHYGQGSGVVLAQVDYKTGRVTSARMLVSTGNSQYDATALQQFRTWKFKPHTVERVKIPISFVRE